MIAEKKRKITKQQQQNVSQFDQQMHIYHGFLKEEQNQV